MSTKERKDIFAGLEQWSELNKDLNRPTPQGNYQPGDTGFRPHSPLESKANLATAGKQVLAKNTDPEDEEINTILKNFDTQVKEIGKDLRKPKHDFYYGLRDILKKEGDPLSAQSIPSERGRQNANNAKDNSAIPRSKSTKSGKSLEKKRPKGLDSLESFVENELKALDSMGEPKTFVLDGSQRGTKKFNFDSPAESDRAQSRQDSADGKAENAVKDLAKGSIFSKMLGGQPKTESAKLQHGTAKKKNFFEDEYDELARILGLTREELTKKLEEEEKQKSKEEKPAAETQEEIFQGDEYDELAKLLAISREELLDILRASRINKKFDNTDSAKKKQKKKTVEEEYDELSEILGIPKKELKEKLKGRKKNKPEDLGHFVDKILNQELPGEKKPNKTERKDHISELEELAGRLGTGSGPNYGEDGGSALNDPNALQVKADDSQNQQKKSPKKTIAKVDNKSSKPPLGDDYDDLARILGIDREQLLKKLNDEEEQKKQKLLSQEGQQPAESNKTLRDEYDELAELLGISREKLLELLRASRKKKQLERAAKKNKKKSLEDFYDDLAEITGIPKKELKSRIQASKKKLPDNLELLFDKVLSKPLPEEENKEKPDQKAPEDDYDELARILGVNREELTKKLVEDKTEETQAPAVDKDLPHGDEYDELAATLDIPRDDLLEILRGKLKFETPDPSKKKKKRSLEEDYEELALILGIPKKELKEKFKARKKKLPWDLGVFFERILDRDPPGDNAANRGKKDPIQELEVIVDRIKGNKAPEQVNSGETISSPQDVNLKDAKNKKGAKGKPKDKADGKKSTFDEDYDELANILGMDQDSLFKKLKDLEEDDKQEALKKEQEALSKQEKERIIQEEKQRLEEEKRLIREKLEEEEKQRRQQNAQNAEKYQKERLAELEKLKNKYHTDEIERPTPLDLDQQGLEEDHSAGHNKKKKDANHPGGEAKARKPDPEMIPYINQHQLNLTNLDKLKRGLMGEYDVYDLPGGSGVALQDAQDSDFDPTRPNQQGSGASGEYGYRQGGNELTRGSTGSADRGNNYYMKGRRLGAHGEKGDNYILELDAEENYGNENDGGADGGSRSQKTTNDSRRKGKQGLRGNKSSSLDTSADYGTDIYSKSGVNPSSTEGLLENGSANGYGREGATGAGSKTKHGKGIVVIAEVKDGKLEESSPAVRSNYLSKKNQGKRGAAEFLTVDHVATQSYYTDEEGDAYYTHNREQYSGTHRKDPFYLGEEFEIPLDQSPGRKMREYGLDPEEWEEIEIIEEFDVEVTDETDEEPDVLDDLEEEKAEHVPILISQTPAKKKKKVQKKTKKERVEMKKMIEQKKQDKIEHYIEHFGFLEALARNTLQFDLSSQETRDEFGDKDVSVQNALYRSYLTLRRLGRYLTLILNAFLKPIDYEELVHPRAYLKAFKDRINIRITKNVAVLFAFFTLMMTIYCLAVSVRIFYNC